MLKNVFLTNLKFIYLYIPMENVHLINHHQRNKLESFGFVIKSELTSEASSKVINKLRTVIQDISDVYSLNQLIMMYDAMFGEDFVIPIENREERFSDEVYVKPSTIKNDGKRKKVRIDLTQDSSYAIPLFEHMSRHECFQLVEIKTGLAIKYNHQGFLCNVINFNELRTINGVLFGNLYFNNVRNEEQFLKLCLDKEYKWFRGFACVPKVDIYTVIESLDRNIPYLIELSTTSQKRRLNNTNKLLQKV